MRYQITYVTDGPVIREDDTTSPMTSREVLEVIEVALLGFGFRPLIAQCETVGVVTESPFQGSETIVHVPGNIVGEEKSMAVPLSELIRAWGEDFIHMKKVNS